MVPSCKKPQDYKDWPNALRYTINREEETLFTKKKEIKHTNSSNYNTEDKKKINYLFEFLNYINNVIQKLYSYYNTKKNQVK